MDGDPGQNLETSSTKPHRTRISMPAQGSAIYHALIVYVSVRPH